MGVESLDGMHPYSYSAADTRVHPAQPHLERKCVGGRQSLMVFLWHSVPPSNRPVIFRWLVH
jgi:hypothetical protein